MSATLISDRYQLGDRLGPAPGTAPGGGITPRAANPATLRVTGAPAARRNPADTAHDPPTGEMTVKLTDFGIARAAEQTRLTQVGSVVGTAAYLAPEQARGDEATSASDVYALGVVIYQLLTGRLPWEGSTLAELAVRRESERPLAPSSYDPDVPETLSAAVLRSLEGDPAARYLTARQLSVALRAGLTGEEPPPAGAEAPTRALPGGTTEATRRLPATASPAPTLRRAPAPPPPARPPASRPPQREPRR